MEKSVIEQIFAKDVFNDSVMQERLPKPVYKKLRNIIDNDLDLDPEIAGAVAHAMKEWAMAVLAMTLFFILKILTKRSPRCLLMKKMLSATVAKL